MPAGLHVKARLVPTQPPTSATARATSGSGPAGIRGHRARPGLALALAASALFIGLALFGARVHWVEEAGSAERDGYAAQAASILAGELPRDPFRPALYPLAAAAVAGLSGVSAFTGARLVSNLAAVALACLAWFIARRLAGGRSAPRQAEAAAWLAFLLTAVNPNLWILGQHATTDMTFAALAAGTVAAGLVYMDRPGWRPALAAGALLGLATFTRANALFLVPALLLAWWLAGTAAAGQESGGGVSRRRRHLAGAAGITLLFLVPHFALRAAAFGDPFHDENWKNLAFKLYGFQDWSYLERVPFAGPWELLAADPGAVVSGFVSELGRFLAGGGLSQLLGTPLHALAFVAGAVVAVWAAAGRRRALWLLFAAATFLCAVAATFFAWGRLLLVLLPLGNAFIAAPLGLDRWKERLAGVDGGWLIPRRLAAAFLVATLGLVALLAVKTFAFRLPAFAANHPYATVEALLALEDRTPPGTVLAATSPYLGRYLDRPYLYVPDAFGEEVTDPDLYLANLRDLLHQEDAAYLVVDPVDLRDRPRSLLGQAPPAAWLAPVRPEGDAPVRVWRVEQVGLGHHSGSASSEGRGL